MRRESSPALAPLAPKRKQGHCALAPAWLPSSWLASQKPREVSLTLISPPLASQHGGTAPEEVLRRLPREAWPSRGSWVFAGENGPYRATTGATPWAADRQ